MWILSSECLNDLLRLWGGMKIQTCEALVDPKRNIWWVLFLFDIFKITSRPCLFNIVLKRSIHDVIPRILIHQGLSKECMITLLFICAHIATFPNPSWSKSVIFWRSCTVFELRHCALCIATRAINTSWATAHCCVMVLHLQGGVK